MTPPVQLKSTVDSATQIDVVHLTFKPPFVPGSYNRAIGVQMERIPEIGQRAISYWEGAPPACNDLGARHTILARSEGLSAWQRCVLRLPYRARRRLTGIGDRQWLIYIWKVLSTLNELQPKVVICYDAHNLGPLLRRAVNWPCRLVLSQHGLSYFLDTEYSRRMYGLQSFDAIHALSHVSYQQDRARLPAYEAEVTVVPNWTDVEIFQPVREEEKRRLRAQWGLPAGRKVVLWISRLVPSKGAHLLVASWRTILAETGNAWLWIVGGADANSSGRKYQDYLRSLIDAAGLQNDIRLQGAVSPERTATCYGSADVYVFPTLAAEGCGYTLLEAMACGLPCVASDYPVGREMFSEREVVFVPNPNLADAFVSPLVRVLNDAELAVTLGHAARTAIVSRFSYEQIAPRICDFYRRQMELTGFGSQEELAEGTAGVGASHQPVRMEFLPADTTAKATLVHS